MARLLIFHSPTELHQQALTGSSVRPRQMWQAFSDLGVEVIVVDGNSGIRMKRWTDALARSKEVIGVYSELSARPIALTDQDYLPRRPFMDMQQFCRLQKNGIPVAAFYRDVHWRFAHYRQQLSVWQRACATPFYLLELKQISRCVSHLFLPSEKTLEYIPLAAVEGRMSALPPGCVAKDRKLKTGGNLNLLYVGGIRPPVHDISPILSALKELPSVEMNLCCREKEWEEFRAFYDVPANVTVVHRSGDELGELYGAADVFVMQWRLCEYLRFAMPVKLFEAIGYGIPVITNKDSEMGRFVAQEGFGWTAGNSLELKSLLVYLEKNREEVGEVSKTVESLRTQHSWKARAATVMNVLESLKSRREVSSCTQTQTRSGW